MEVLVKGALVVGVEQSRRPSSGHLWRRKGALWKGMGGEWAEMNQQCRLQPKASLGPLLGEPWPSWPGPPTAKVSGSRSRTLPSAWHIPTLVLEKTPESPLDCKEIQPVHSEGDQPWDFFGRNDAKAEDRKSVV